MSKAKGGTGKGTGKKGWTRWDKMDKTKKVKKNYGAIRAAAKESENANSNHRKKHDNESE